MSPYVLFLALVIATVVGQSLSDPTLCCLASNFTAVLTDLQTISKESIDNLFITLDFARQREAAISTAFNTVTRQTTTYGRTVFDFAAKRQYYIPADDPSNCRVSELNWFTPHQCVPSDANYLGSNYLGLPGSLDYNAWRYSFGSGTNATLTMVFSSQGCVPVLEGVTGDLNGPQDKQFLFSGYTPNNMDPGVFLLPASCKQ